uniref:Uncharacterized protein n=2 Tax=unclassified bacterial viruses TaxID=12333 RepID=A0A8S5R6H4_9VIRU|nr:MAG TPA: hypothetical protein [virus sp. cthq354]DAE27626.1 MAG TPA: hypothetical protein [virus sp. ctf7E27]
MFTIDSPIIFTISDIGNLLIGMPMFYFVKSKYCYTCVK